MRGRDHIGLDLIIGFLEGGTDLRPGWSPRNLALEDRLSLSLAFAPGPPLLSKRTSKAGAFALPAVPLSFVPRVRPRDLQAVLFLPVLLLGQVLRRVARAICICRSAPTGLVGTFVLGLLVVHVHGAKAAEGVPTALGETHDVLLGLRVRHDFGGKLEAILEVFDTHTHTHTGP